MTGASNIEKTEMNTPVSEVASPMYPRALLESRSVLAKLSYRTLKHYGLLYAKSRKLVTLLDECPIGDGTEASFPSDLSANACALAEEIDKLACSVNLRTTDYVRPVIFSAPELPRQVLIYVSYLHELCGDRANWGRIIPGSSFGQIGTLKLPDQLIELSSSAKRRFDELTCVDGMAQSICDWEQCIRLFDRYDESRVQEASKRILFREFVDRACTGEFTGTNDPKHLNEFRGKASPIGAGGRFRHELTSIATVLTTLDAAELYLREKHHNYGSWNMADMTFESALGGIWDLAQSQGLSFSHYPNNNSCWMNS